MPVYIPTIGLEIHAELKTKTKMFCCSKNDTDEKRPNVNICPVCMGHPGTLPVINKEAVKHVLKVGIAAGGTLADFTEFDRKNYFYPDIPKSYQISQYKYPLVSGGEIGGVALTRVHLEEDTARSSHDKGDYSLVDFNRAGLPLMELVTEPVIHSGEQAGAFARELQLILQYLGAGEANMEKGEMRVEANISIATEEDTAAKKFGTKVEVKNLNSFRSVERAIAYEVARHARALEKGEKILQETRGWDDTKQSTFSQRAKEDSHDYRYFPDPDLPKLYISEITDFARPVLEKEMAELPKAKRARYASEYGIKAEDIEIYINTFAVGTFFEQVMIELSNDAKLAKLASNYLVSDLMGLMKGASESGESGLGKLVPKGFAALIRMVAENKITSRAAKDILATLYTQGGEPLQIAEQGGLMQKNDEGELKTMMAQIVAANPKVIADYKAGKAAALQSLVGQGMKATKGSANPELLKKILIEMV